VELNVSNSLHWSAFRKTRIAPTPSGYLHLGNILSFSLTAAFAAQSGASILLRIDDMDRERYQPRFAQDIFDTLNFLELPWHEGPNNLQSFEREYAQVHRKELYASMLQRLRDNNSVFGCACSRSEILKRHPSGNYLGFCSKRSLQLDAENLSWRVRTHNNPVSVTTVHGLISEVLPESMHYFIVRRKDGAPAYQVCSLADDIYFGIDFVVRGADLWPSTVAQSFLADCLAEPAFQQIKFFHHKLLTTEAGLKLSKSAGDTSVYQLRREGRKPAEVYNLIARSLGISGNISNWEKLAESYLKKYYPNEAGCTQ
jgi:glutamyl/glutaminyl-tRNA synthetase